MSQTGIDCYCNAWQDKFYRRYREISFHLRLHVQPGATGWHTTSRLCFAVNITKHVVLNVDGQSFSYDYLDVATGHVFCFCWKQNRDALTEFLRDNGKLESSESVLIIGGGQIVVELAAEITVESSESSESVLIIADITNIHEIKEGYLAQKYALLVAKNLKLFFKGSPPCKLATYNTDFPLAIVSLRRNEGLAQLPCLTLTFLSYASTRKQMEFPKRNKIAHVPHSGKHRKGLCFLTINDFQNL